jgi:type II secretory ATPase GspE/PulE/Tfp pilus assembly ATPase PilB-like protein
MENHKLAELLSESTARQLLAVPVDFKDNIITFMVSNDKDPNLSETLGLATGKMAKLVVADLNTVKAKLNELYGQETVASSSSGFRYRSYSKSDNADLNKLKLQLDAAPVVRLVDEIITSGIKWGASDIHIEPYDKYVRVRYRIDGKLQEVEPIPLDKKLAVTSRIKIMAELDVAERRRPQDGRIRVEGENRLIDIRVSVVPTDFGEKVALRILDKSQLKLDLDSLGMSEWQLQLFRDKLSKTNGIILVTGPTGSGKTTTLYAALNHVKSPEINIMTIEDPIEYNLDGINQSQVKPEIGYTFANALRTFLRQDPDILMVGEIRDEETAEIAVRASLTGHIVLSTLHTNDAASAVARLINMGIEPHLLASSLSMVIAQRLVRVLCPKCKENYAPSDAEQTRLGLVGSKEPAFFTPHGCDYCLGTGFKGRLGVYELLLIDEEISGMITGNTATAKYRGLIESKFQGLIISNARILASNGMTSLAEISSL